MTTLRKSLRFLTGLRIGFHWFGLSAIILLCFVFIAGCATLNQEMDNNADSKLSKEDSLDFDADKNGAKDAAAQGPADEATGEVNITDIRYVSRRGGGTVVVETSQPATFHTRETTEQNQVIVEVANAHLPDRLKHPYITSEFGQSIASVNAYQNPGSTTARVVIQFKTPMTATVTQAGKKLLVLASNLAKQNASDSTEIDELASAAGREGGADDSRILPNSSGTSGIEPTKYYGRPISIEVRDTPVRDVINLIAEQSGANIIVPNDIEGTITLKLKQIPWDQALLIVMKSKGLGYIRQDRILRIAPFRAIQEEADLAKKLIDAQKASEPLKVKMIPVSYAKVGDLVNRIKPFMTPIRGQIAADERTSTLIVTDLPEVLERVASVVKALDTPPLQVMIEGKVVEAQEDFTRNYGLNWGFSGQPKLIGGNVNLLTNNLTIAPTTPIGGAGVYNISVGSFDIFGDLDATLGLAESEDLIKIVSSPRVVTMNNEAATINQAVNIFIAQPTTITGPSGPTAGVSYVSVPVPLTLTVTPQVTNEGDVIMAVTLNNSFLGKVNAQGQPDIQQRTATTKVMVRNGQTSVIGGVYNSNQSQSDAGVPWLSSIPVLGWLFKSRSTVNSKNELLLFLTPRIINGERNLSKEANL